MHHNLIQEVLLYHHTPAKTKELISSPYSDFHMSVITDNYLTPAIPVRKGFSFHYKLDCLFKPIHWFQFADDAAVVTTNERENQLLLNCFTKWCTWSDMNIRVDKYVTFGIKKFSSRSLQYKPKLLINNDIVPTVKSGNSYRYLACYFNFEMDNEVHKEKLKSSLLDMLTRIDALPVLPKSKLLLYQRYILSKTILAPSIKFVQCLTVLQNALQSWQHDAITSLWKSTGQNMNVQHDSYKSTKHVLTMVRQEHTEKLQSKFPSQDFIITFLLNHSLTQLSSLWSSAQSSLPKSIFNFTVRYLNSTLANRTNFFKWKLSSSHDFSFCFETGVSSSHRSRL